MLLTLVHLLRWASTLYVLLAIVWPFASRRYRHPARMAGRAVEFLPHPLVHWLWMPMAVGAVWYSWSSLVHATLEINDLCAAFAYAAVTCFHLFEHPGTIMANDAGLEQLYWLRANKRIGWGEIDGIEMGRPTSPIVLVGLDGTRIVYWNSLSGRSELIRAINEHCRGNLPPEFPQS